MHDLGHVVVGAALVTIGVLVAALADRIRGLRGAGDRIALADRIRGLRGTRDTGACLRAGRAQPRHDVLAAVQPAVFPQSEPAVTKENRASRAATRIHSTKPTVDGANHVIAALVGAGYKKATATESTWACSEAERATTEDWARAALRRCSLGGIS
jgi:hypothetical protein